MAKGMAEEGRGRERSKSSPTDSNTVGREEVQVQLGAVVFCSHCCLPSPSSCVLLADSTWRSHPCHGVEIS